MKENGNPTLDGETRLERYFAKKISTDPDVRKRMEKLIPSWFIDTVALKKQELLELSRDMRQEFESDRRKEQISFFNQQHQTKQELLELAKTGSYPPRSGTSLYRSLVFRP
jgi:hypothetical protein